MRKTLPAALLLAAAGCSGGGGGSASLSGDGFVLVWTANLSATRVATSASTSSSSRLLVSWNPPANLAVARYDVIVSESGATPGPSRSTSTVATSLTLENLKSGTSYLVSVQACDATPTCHNNASAPTTVETPAEVWQLQGVGRTLAGLSRIVSDGNVKIHALRLGDGAGADLAGRLRLYYGPSGPNVRGLAVAVSSAAASATDPFSYLTFTSRAGSSGLTDPASASPLVRSVATGQAVAMSSTGRVRLYFEALGNDGRTRIMSVESQDGYSGLDFNAGAASICSTAADYSAGGGCAPTVAIGVEGDTVAGSPRLQNVRQFKIGVPTATDWRWDGAAGTFMVFTTDAIAGCSTATPNQGYAVWSGTQWDVQYLANGCPKLFASMQAAHPLHLGGARYKLYYGDPSDATGRLAGSMLPFLGPKKVLYADGASTGDATRVDYEDWEPTSRGRPLTFLWPDGTALDAAAEGYIDDFSVVTPTGTLGLQVLYLAITDGTMVPFTAVATLLNP